MEYCNTERRVIYCYADCRYGECHYAECHYAECHYAECHYAECHYARCRYAQSHYADYSGTLSTLLLAKGIPSTIFYRVCCTYKYSAHLYFTMIFAGKIISQIPSKYSAQAIFHHDFL